MTPYIPNNFCLASVWVLNSASDYPKNNCLSLEFSEPGVIFENSENVNNSLYALPVATFILQRMLYFKQNGLPTYSRDTFFSLELDIGVRSENLSKVHFPSNIYLAKDALK